MAEVAVVPGRPLSQKQRAIFNFMIKFTIDHFYQPSLRDVMAEFNFTSPNAVVAHLRAMEIKGFLKLAKHDGPPNQCSHIGQRARCIEFIRRTPIEERESS